MPDRLVALGYTAGWSVLRAIPPALASPVFDAAADLAVRRRGPGIVQLAANLARVLGPAADPSSLMAVTRAAARSYARYWRETFQLPGMDLDEVAAGAQAGSIGLEHVRAGVESGRGVVVVLPHSGNWDVAGLMICRLFGGLTTVAERLNPPSVYEKFLAYRRSLGMEILPLTGGEQPASVILKQRLREGKVVCLLGDRDLTGSGVDVQFFGARAQFPAGPALLAAVTGADLVPVHLSFTADGWRQRIGSALPPPPGRLSRRVSDWTQQVADHFAAGIAQHPADWHMMQPLWSDLRIARQTDAATQVRGQT